MGRTRLLATVSLLLLAILAFPIGIFGHANPPQSTVAQNLSASLEQGRLEVEQPERREIPGGQAHFYVIVLKTGQFFRLAILPANVATVIRLFSPIGDEKLLEMNLLPQTRSPEPLYWVAKTPGEYRLEITTLGQAAVYEYEIKLDERRVAVPDDQNRIVLQALFEQARALTAKGDYAGSVEFLKKALSLSHELKDREREAAASSSIGTAYRGLFQYEKALLNYEQALAIAYEIKNPQREVSILRNIAKVYEDEGQGDKRAMGYYEQALAIAREAKDRRSEGDVLNDIAGRTPPEKAIGLYEDALTIAREVKDSESEATVLIDLGSAYQFISQYENAIRCNMQALAIVHDLKNVRKEASVLNNLGNAYSSLGQYENAIDYQKQALAIFRAMKARGGEAIALNNVGDSYIGLGRYDDARGCYEQALPIAKETKRPMLEGETLENLGGVYSKLGEYEKAITYADQGLPLLREVRCAICEGQALSILGEAYFRLGQYEKAILNYEQAVAKQREAKDREDEAMALEGLMEGWKASNSPRLAVFYGKQAVNTVQSIRSDIHGLSPELQKSFLRGNEKPYHTLADLLIAQGRLTEAEQVLNLLKEEEYFDFVRRDSVESSALTQHADLTPDEAAWEKRYREIGDKLVALGTEHEELLDKKSLTPDEAKRLAQLDQDLAAGNAAFEKFLSELADHFNTTTEAIAKVEQLREAQGMMEDLRELPKGTVAIYTLVGEDKYRSILVTPDVQKAYDYPIKAAELNRKILDFRQATENPKLDPRPLGEELYKVLVAKLADDLKQAKAKTVMWSLDGALRYLPVAALYDGKQYVVEQYAMSVFTPASNARLKDRPDRDWTAAGFGVTKAREGATALPDVAIELSSIISQKPGQGILQGVVKLDDQFTEDAMRQTLLKHYPVVHIASHFRFQPGNETNSFLLLGDGNHLSLAEMKTLPNLFGGVQLLTLSACNTGVGDVNEDGKEVEGLGVLAQRKGAKAVVASLWSVADVSTSLLMQEFYRTRETTTVTKVEALREAQLAMLRGTVKGSQNASAHRELLHRDVAKAGQPEAPSFAVDPKTPFAHPYYWAPFFLMGNWL